MAESHTMIEPTKTTGSRCFSVLLAVVIALCLCKIGVLIAAGQAPLQFDAITYWNGSQRILAGDWLLVHDPPEVTRTPGYLLFVAFFQATCGTRALAAAIITQHLLLFAGSLLACWGCWQLTRTKSTVLLCLAMSFFCISSHAVAVNLLSDPLLSFLLTLCAASVIAWFQSPSVTKAGAIGAALGAAILVKPVAQLAWVPVVAAMLFALGGGLPLRKRLAHAACVLIVAGLVVAPWLIRNQVYFGSPFLTKFAGRSLWVSCFQGNPEDRVDPPIPFANRSATREVLRMAPDVDPHNTWKIHKSLLQLGYSQIAADELMFCAAKEAILAHPGKYAANFSVRAAWFWITPNGTFRPLTGEYFSSRQSHDAEKSPGGSQRNEVPDQVQWRSAWYFEKGWLNYIWFPHPVLYAIATGITLASIVLLCCVPERRALAVFFGLWFSYFTAICVLGARPEYRYRMILEPSMIIVVVTAVEHVLARCRLNHLVGRIEARP
ncbi:MAG: hypothetical protein ACLP9L_34905 [Thermoguttaceae bacterium]